ncbi:MAG: SGNH/GDSL hydrolase family protein [Pseudomonadota bacterium]
MAPAARRKLALYALMTVLVVGSIEAALQLAAALSSRAAWLLGPPEVVGQSTDEPVSLTDPVLTWRPNPAFPEHDRNGFRNVRVPDRARIVALGDSQTYGTGVQPSEAWPKQLEALLDEPVYSMAFGGWGPAHSWLLIDDALQLRPDVVVVAVYSGNDLYDAFDLVYKRGQAPALKNPSRGRSADIQARESSEPLRVTVGRMFNLGAPAPPPSGDSLDSSSISRSARSVRLLLSHHSRTYGLLRRLRYELRADLWERAKAFAAMHPRFTEVLELSDRRTVLTPAYRLTALDLDDVRILEGRRIVVEALDRAHARVSAAGARFVTLLIPTKELVFASQQHPASATYLSLLKNERSFWHGLKKALADRGIEYVDALPALRTALARGPQPYQVTTDGHPTKHGHQAIAGLVGAFVGQAR